MQKKTYLYLTFYFFDSHVILKICQSLKLFNICLLFCKNINGFGWHDIQFYHSVPILTHTFAHLQRRSEFGQNSVADLFLASDPALLVSAPALALVAGATNLSKMAAQCFLFHSFVPFMPHFKTQINTTDTSSPPSLSVGSLACLWHAGLFGTRLITARGLVINQGHVERDSRGPPVFQTIPPLSISHFRWPVLQVQCWAKGFSFLIN